MMIVACRTMLHSLDVSSQQISVLRLLFIVQLRFCSFELPIGETSGCMSFQDGFSFFVGIAVGNPDHVVRCDDWFLIDAPSIALSTLPGGKTA